jgi:hypothetical protein
MKYVRDIIENEYIVWGGGIIVVIYILLKLFSVQRDVVESLTNNDSPPGFEIMAKGKLDDLKKSIKMGEDMLRIDKYKNEYEDLIIDLDEIVNYGILTSIIMVGDKVAKGNNKDKMNVDALKEINELYKFKEILNSTMEFLDKK